MGLEMLKGHCNGFPREGHRARSPVGRRVVWWGGSAKQLEDERFFGE